MEDTGRSGNAIVVEELTRKFADLTAVDHVSFTVPTGELFGLLGPNGAGKTTILNMLTTLLSPTSGKATVAGYDIVRERNEVRRHIGVVFQEPALEPSLTGRENLDFHAMMYGIKKAERDRRIGEILSLIELEEKSGVLVENYSGGMRRRLEIGRGLIHRPTVLFLDEPTLGLDAQTRRKIWEYVKKMNQETDVTIILTTHYMDEADYLCERIAIIDHGSFVAMDTPANLKDVMGGDVITLEVEDPGTAEAEHFRTMPWVHQVLTHDHQIVLTVEFGEKRVPELISHAQEHGLKILSVSLHKPSLEDVFLQFTGKSIREHEVSHAESIRQTVTRRVRRR
ncbi:MAG: ATP-binding cassette domain-containing protein [Methanomicrobiales archaeon]|nr:ATP-binding cassette domain-containing protein [Methanomicrobiales archaeon]